MNLYKIELQNQFKIRGKYAEFDIKMNNQIRIVAKLYKSFQKRCDTSASIVSFISHKNML